MFQIVIFYVVLIIKLNLKLCDMGSYKETESNIKHCIICICGESGSGKTYLANKLKDSHTIVLDGDAVRKYINYDLTYTDEDRYKNNLIISNIAELLYYQGHYIIISTVRADIAYDILKRKGVECKLIKLC